jgi:shikimate 5-dehydrogenase
VTDRLHFIGVSTAGSSMTALFPRWADLLGIEAELVGRDVSIGADGDRFRTEVELIARDPRVRGALVTTHKVSVYGHASGLFAELDANARLCREVSCISKRRDGRLVGHAKDPLTAGATLDELLGRDYWRDRDARVLCLGAGGAGTAITVHLVREPHPPAAIVVTDTSWDRLDALRAIHEELGSAARLELHAITGAGDADGLLADLPAESLVVNATGMGKDLAGSPLTDHAAFPERAVVWELNYRGRLDFLGQARAQERVRDLRVHDGWRYFVHGWAEVLAVVFDLPVGPERLDELAAAAEPFRP